MVIVFVMVNSWKHLITDRKVFIVFSAAMDGFRDETVMGFKPGRKHAFRCKAGRTAQ